MKRAIASLLVILVLAGLTPSSKDFHVTAMPVAALPSASVPDVSVPAPSSGLTGPIYSASATWCKPTKTQCQSWAPPALLAAVNSFRWGDPVYVVRVWRGQAYVDVTVVSFCQCRDSLHAIDLSVAAWTKLEPNLGIGRIDVLVEVLGEGPRVTLPPTSVGP